MSYKYKIKNSILKLPYFDQLRSTILKTVFAYSNRKIFKNLESGLYPKGKVIKKVLEQSNNDLNESEKTWIKKIESERQVLLNRVEPIVDGRFGDGKIGDVINENRVSIRRACESSKKAGRALLLYLIARDLQPENVIELGTNVGISSAYISAALNIIENKGQITTLDASPYRQFIAQEVHNNLKLDNISYVEGLFSNTLNKTLKRISPVDMAFIDGHHKYKPTLDYFEKILMHSANDAVFIFDDIRRSDEMEKAWSEIQNDERLGLIIDLNKMGICVRRNANIDVRYSSPIIYLF